MKHIAQTLSLALAATAASALAGEARVVPGARLRLREARTTFAPAAFLPDWNGRSASGGYAAEPDGSYAFSIPLGEARLSGRAVFDRSDDGSLAASWTFTPDRDADAASVYVGAGLGFSDGFRGGSALCDGRVVAFPEDEPASPFLFGGEVSALDVRDASGATRLSLSFPRPTSILLQDNRRWNGQNVALRVQAAAGHLAAGVPATAAFSLSGPDAAAFVPARPTVIAAGPDWIPVAVEPDIEPGSALDFSAVVPRDAPAGRHGYAVAKGQNFEFERLPGVPQRFYGANLCFGANFVDREAARRVARRFARIGYNAVRFHHHDGGLVRGSPDGTTLDPAQIERFDGLAAAFIDEGVYLTTDLFVSRDVPFRACGIDRDGRIPGSDFKTLVQFHEGVYSNYLRFASNFLSHVNPHTGRSYAEEPALAFLALVNEGNLGNHGTGAFRDYPECAAAWRAWLAARKASDPGAYAAVSDAVPDNLWNPADPQVPPFVAFLRESEERFAARTAAFLRDQLHCRALLADMSSWFFPVAYQYPRSESYGYVDDHFYVDHPHFLEKSWRLPSSCPNANPMLGEAMGAQGLAVRRLLDRPLALTEYNYSAPGRFRGVGGIATGAAAALQNWAGLWRFAWSHDALGMLDPARKPMAYFDLSGDPLSLAAERASICLFLRRDLPELPLAYAYTLPAGLPERDAAAQCRAAWSWASWYAKIGGVVGDAVPAGAIDAGPAPQAFARTSAEVRAALGDAPMGGGALSIDPDAGTFLLDTPRTAGGFAESGAHAAGPLSFEILPGGTAATVWVSSLDGRPVRESSRLLLTHLTDVQNTGTSYADEERTILLAWGGVPHLMANGEARIALSLAERRWKVHALSTGGARRREVPAAFRDGVLSFSADIDADPASATFLYEIVAE